MKKIFLCAAALLSTVSHSDLVAKYKPHNKESTSVKVIQDADQQGLIGVLDMDKISDKCLASKSLNEQTEFLRQSIQKEIDKRESALRAEEQTIDKTKLTPAEFEAKQKSFANNVKKLQEFVVTQNNDMQVALQKAMLKLRDSLEDVTQTYSSGNKLLIVVPANICLYRDSSQVVDITDEVIKRLDKSLPKVEIELQAAK